MIISDENSLNNFHSNSIYICINSLKQLLAKSNSRVFFKIIIEKIRSRKERVSFPPFLPQLVFFSRFLFNKFGFELREYNFCYYKFNKFTTGDVRNDIGGGNFFARRKYEENGTTHSSPTKKSFLSTYRFHEDEIIEASNSKLSRIARIGNGRSCFTQGLTFCVDSSQLKLLY